MHQAIGQAFVATTPVCNEVRVAKSHHTDQSPRLTRKRNFVGRGLFEGSIPPPFRHGGFTMTDEKSLPKTIQEADKPLVSSDGHQRFKESVKGDPADAISDSQRKASGGAAYGQEK
jgi:hypothetical protein